MLLEMGNLVLRDGSGNDVWQSFDHAADTYLPGMKLSVNLTTGPTRLPDSSSTPPIPITPCRTASSRVPRSLRSRMGPWDGKLVTTYRKPWNNNSLIVYRIAKGDHIFVSFSMADNSMFGRLVLEYTGILKIFIWVESLHKLASIISFLGRTCDFYRKCGPFAACVQNQNWSSCRCLDVLGVCPLGPSRGPPPLPRRVEGVSRRSVAPTREACWLEGTSPARKARWRGRLLPHGSNLAAASSASPQAAEATASPPTRAIRS
ncbi:hypothetical protein Taro_053895 [Colocasia esculenta]|uniref:Bulb-type lectin domain-containing protein n=1 Tax=Colocasia esculenta TaxID=4460 RepID=A0A843XPG1_COLES|nr:hypothetical protein [Colocasia esculenta]